MDEENNNSGFVQKAGNMAKEAVKQQTKNAAKQYIKKVIMTILPVLLKVLVPLIIAVILASAISNWIDKLKSSTAKEASSSAIYNTSGSKTTEPNKILVDSNNATSNGAYELKYEFQTKDGTIITGQESLEQIKRDLLVENADLDLSQFSDSELQIIGALMYNGLKVENYNEEELKALTIFVKAGIASESFDLRPKEQIGNKITIDDMRDSNEVFGTIQVHKTSLITNSNEELLGHNEIVLEFIPYGDSSTEGTFCYMIEHKNEDVINKFSLNDNGNLVIAKWTNKKIQYQYLAEDETPLSQEEIEALPLDDIYEDIEERFLDIEIIDYKNILSEQCVMSFGLLSDLLITTKNVDFCLDLAQMAFNSKVVINIKEELKSSIKTTTTNYEDTIFFYDYLKYEISGEISETTESWVIKEQAYGDPAANETLVNVYGWNAQMPYTETGEMGRTYIYDEWTSGNKTYYLKYSQNGSYQYWYLYEKQEETTNSSVDKLQNTSANGDLIAIYQNDELGEQYTDIEKINYTIVETSINKSSTYICDISEIDIWYKKYKKAEYTLPEKNEETFDDSSTDEGEYSEKEIYYETDNESEILAHENVSNFINYKKNDYRTLHPEAENIEAKVTYLTTERRTKTKYNMESHRTIKEYKYDDTSVDTTEAQKKNVEYIGEKPSFTSIDSEGNIEEGFLYYYDKYITAGEDLFLENDSEKKLFEFLDGDGKSQTGDKSTESASEIIKFLLFVYDGKDRGVTELNLGVPELNQLDSVKGLYGNTIADKIWYTLRSLGYSKASVAGVLGNLHYESSGLNPDIVERDTGNGIGLAQWSFDRRESLEAYAAHKGVEWSNEDTQIEFLIDEIDGHGKFTDGHVTQDEFLNVEYNGIQYNKNVWQNVDEENEEEAIEIATKAFCISWERPEKPSESLDDRILFSKQYFEDYKDKEYGGIYTTQGCASEEHVQKKFISTTGRTFSILQQTSSFLSGKCNRAACICIASGYADSNKSIDELVNDFAANYDSHYHGVIPSNSAYWNKYGLEVTNAYAGENTKEYAPALEAQLNSGGYALIWLNNNEEPYYGVSGTRWSKQYHWIAILGIKYENGECLIAASTSGAGTNDWININEFTNLGVSHMVFVSPM